MDLGKILDGTPEPTVVKPSLLLNGETANTSGDYALPVPMTEFQKTLADQVISAHYSEILKFFETNDSTVVDSLNTLYVNSQLVATHPYLLVDHYLPHNMLLKDVPHRLAAASGKFKVLGDILELVRDLKLNVALVSRPGKSFDLIEAFVLGRFVNYRRHSGAYLREMAPLDADYSTVHLIPSSQFDGSYRPGADRFDVVLAFDATVDPSDAYVQAIRTAQRTTLAPVVRLVPLNSVEHAIVKTRAHAGDLGEGLVLRRVLAALVVLRGKIGAIPSELRPVYGGGLRYLAPWFRDPSGPWLLPDIPDIREYTAADVERSLLTEVYETPYNATPPKRDDADSERGSYYEAKRLKRETDVVAAADGAAAGKTFDTDRERTSHVLTHALLRRLDDLVRENGRLSAEVGSFRATASERQRKLEDAFEELGAKVTRIEELESAVTLSQRRADRAQGDTDRARAAQQKAEDALESVRQDLQKDADKATLSSQRERITELEAELARANDRLASKDKDIEYARSEYQRASAAAVEARAEIATLQQENADLRVKADAEFVRLRQLTMDDQRVAAEDHAKELAARVEFLEEQLKRVSENDKSTSRSRYTSRASSVPRRTKSPASYSRLGSPSV